MLTEVASYQIVIALLKEYGIRHLVISAGTRHTPFVRSVENDPDFTCYSVVDERSASFFAIGLIKELHEPVVINCTSGTSICNYVSGATEALYANLPLVIIASDRNRSYLYQQEEQMVPQPEILSSVCKYTAVLPLIKDKRDTWYCTHLVNEALLELNHHGTGPVFINVPVEEHLFDFTSEALPEVRKVDRVMVGESMKWADRAKELYQAKRILVSYGQSEPLTADEEKIVEAFATRYDVAIMVDHLSNLHCKHAVHAYNASRFFYSQITTDFVPDLVICVGGNAIETRGWLTNCSGMFKFWNVSESGKLSDPFRCLNVMYECSSMDFFRIMLENAPVQDKDTGYFEAWNALTKSVKYPEHKYSDIYAVEQLMKAVPPHSLLHLGNSNSVRLPQHYPLDKTVTVECNRGTNGIDGSMSTFIGQAFVHKGLCFLLIGDLSFFYDMNGLWNRYIGKNIRILLNNNACGELFYTNKRQDPKTVGMHIAADHNARAQAWVESRGFTYFSATNKAEFDNNLKKFVDPESEGPIFFEVFTDKFVNVLEIDTFVKMNTPTTAVGTMKSIVKTIIGKK
jgi:2-succinyl-5-enolpyruvyl-6-hydroxy-3-cyclohexene-1-carboxylate synthase